MIEYMTADISIMEPKTTNELNSLGMQGWEMCGTTGQDHYEHAKHSYQIKYIFKRKIQESSP